MAHSARGLSTNSLSGMPICGTMRRSWLILRSSYMRISKSIFRGPLSIIFLRPSEFSMDWSASRSARGSRVVST